MADFKFSNVRREMEVYGYDAVVKSHCRMCHGGCGVLVYTKHGKVAKIAGDPDASGEELAAALKTARAVTFDSHARCGAEGHWSDQAGYFVARAAVAATTPPAHSRAGGPAWQAAMSARMAHTTNLIDDVSNTQSAHTECLWQYQSLSDYLNAQIGE